MDTYIDKITNEVANRTRIKDKNLVRLYALLVCVKGPNITLEDVHDAWAINMNFKPHTDYCFGHDHKSIVPFDELSKETQDKDQKYVDILNTIAKRINNNG
jgi:hypothetical protein